MKLIVGLGNPGSEYEGTRHNIGFAVVKALAARQGMKLSRPFGIAALAGKARMCGKELALALPMTYMNLSGNAVAALCRRYKAGLTDLLVVCDDLDLEFGRVRVRPGGSGGGQRGMASVISALHSQEFARLRVGISRPPRGADAADYVLGKFSNAEKEELPGIIGTACACCQTWVCDGITASMNTYNTKEQE